LAEFQELHPGLVTIHHVKDHRQDFVGPLRPARGGTASSLHLKADYNELRKRVERLERWAQEKGFVPDFFKDQS
jgi:hypothetical protein